MSETQAPERVLIVDDHSLIRDGLRSIISGRYPAADILEAGDFAEALEMLGTVGEVDLVLLDLNIPDASRLSALRQLRSDFPSTPVVMVSGVYDRSTVEEALDVGAAGFIPKAMGRDDIISAIEEVLTGEIYMPSQLAENPDAQEDAAIRERIETLTPQQRVVLGLLVGGRVNKQIAFDLGVSMTTVKAHVSAVLQKMNVYNRTQAVILANKVGFKT